MDVVAVPGAAADVLVPIVAALLGGGILTALLTLRPQRDSIIATASKAAVEAVAGSVKRLEDELHTAYGKIDALEAELEHATEDRDVLRRELELVRARVLELEALLAGERPGTAE